MLIAALGSTTAFFGVPGLAQHALTLKSVEDADAVATRVHEVVRQGAERDEALRGARLSVLVAWPA